MQIFTLAGKPKTDSGKKAGKSARYADEIPAVLYGAGENYMFTTNWADVRHLIYTPEFKLAEITLHGKAHRAIVKDVQFHPVSEKIMHIDFQELVPGRKTIVEVPVKFTGVSPGVKAGGKLVQSLRRVKVKTTPENMVDHLTLDISGLELGQAIRVRDLDIAQDVEVMLNPATPVAVIEIPRALRSAAAKNK